MGTVDKKRTITLIGHNSAGKSLLLSAMLVNAGKLEKVVSKEVDYDPIESERGSSITSHVAKFDIDNYQFTVIDTPGFSDFVGDVINAIFVTENIVSVVNAIAGVEIQTERTWSIAEEMKKPISVFINQMDKERASYEETLNSLKERFERKFVPVFYPIGSEENFRGIVNVFSGEAFEYENGKAKKN